jgi:hypothetical protein
VLLWGRMGDKTEPGSRAGGWTSFAKGFIGAGTCVIFSVGLAWGFGGSYFGVAGLLVLGGGSLFLWGAMLMQRLVEGLVLGAIFSGAALAFKISLASFGEAARGAAEKAGASAPGWPEAVAGQLDYWLVALVIAFLVSRIERYLSWSTSAEKRD